MHHVRFATLTAMILFAAATRVLPHPPNYTPIAAIALFGGATFAIRRLALLTTLAALFLSDLLLEATIRAGVQTGWLGAASSRGFHKGWWVVYGCFVLTVGLGWLLRGRRTLPNVAMATLASSVLFFVITNLAAWYQDSLYPRDLSGLGACYTAAIPYFGWTLAGDAVYATALFGGLALAEGRWSALRDETQVLSPA
jgi:hypothetical protein